MAQKLITGTTAAPVALATATTNYRTLLLIACKGLNGPTASPNTGTVFLGNDPTAGNQPIEMTPGMERSFDAAPGKMEDLKKWFMSVANNGDGVVAIYF